MESSARVVVIGGGVVGVSTLYHLAKKGWSDAVLLERKELTSGSTWHAAGLLPLFNMSYSVGQIHKYSVELYSKLKAEIGQEAGLRQVSNIRLACTKDRMDEYQFYSGVAKTIGVNVKFLSPDEVQEVWPLCSVAGVIGAIQHPDDGYIQPAELTQTLAAGARQLGAKIHRQTAVNGIRSKSNGEWVIETNRGDIICEHVVSATGNFARITGSMVGLEIPVIPVEHQFIVTEAHSEILERQKNGLPEMGVLRDSDASFYMREENGGLILGPYEKGAPCCFTDGPSQESEYELFEPDLDRLEPHIDAAIKRVPIFGEAGVKQIYNGAICYTPDGSPIIGPAWDLKNFWLNEGHSFGITAAGGAGWQLAEWIVDGEPTIDMMGVDPRRFGPYVSKDYLIKKNEEAYSMVFTVHYPDEERPAGRPLKRSPCYERMAEKGAVFGSIFGWERPNWFAPADYCVPDSELTNQDALLHQNYVRSPGSEQIKEMWSFRRSNYFEFVGAECLHVHRKVGVLDMSAFSKVAVEGVDAEQWLESIFANKLPRKNGRIGLCHLLTVKGGVRSEFTVYRLNSEAFYLVSAGIFDRHDFDYLSKACPVDDTVRLRNITEDHGVLVVAGPDSRKLMRKLSHCDFSNSAFPWLSGQNIRLDDTEVKAIRVNFVGELGWELHHPIEAQNTIFDMLFEAGEEFDIKPFGIRAMDSLRLEKSYRLIPRELSIEYSAIESGLSRFIALEKDQFVGKSGLKSWIQRGFKWAFVTLEVSGVLDADARGSEPVYLGSELVGRCTSGGYGWRTERSLALAMVHREHALLKTEFEIEILGKRFSAVVIPESPFDPDNSRLRS